MKWYAILMFTFLVAGTLMLLMPTELLRKRGRDHD